MAEASIPVDLFNPGQIFACLGFLEAVDRWWGDAEAGFDWTVPGHVRFRLYSRAVENPIQEVLGFLGSASVRSFAPVGSGLSTKRWNVPTEERDLGGPFPFPLPSSPAALPAVISSPAGEKTLALDHWGDDRRRTARDNVKFWAGSGGYPGAALALDALDLVRERLPEYAADPFSLSAPQTSSFRFDWRRDYVDVDIGFSLNHHSTMVPVGFPVVEIMAAVGLSNARPDALSKLEYRYGVLGVPEGGDLLDPMLLRAALGASELPMDRRTFRMRLDWPGREGDARCITTVKEDTAR